MPAPLNNKIIDERIKDRPIKRLDDYINAHTKIRFQCIIEDCLNVWCAKPYSVANNGRGCPKCANQYKSKLFILSNEDVDDNLINRNIKRLDDYCGSKNKIHFECLIDGCRHIWEARPANIINSESGCPECAKRAARLSNTDIDTRLANSSIIRTGNYIDLRTAIQFQCIIESCQYSWMAIPSNILHYSKCPKCILSDGICSNNKELDLVISSRNIKRLDDCVLKSYKIRFQCLADDCYNIWETSASYILDGGSCPKCSRRWTSDRDMEYIQTLRLTNEKVDTRLEGRNIKRIGNVIDSKSPIEFLCLDNACATIWNAAPSSIYSNKSGCPKCARIEQTKLATFTNEMVDERLISKNIQRLDDYVNSHIPIHFRCLNISCNIIWETKPMYIFAGNGCPECSRVRKYKLSNEDIDIFLIGKQIKRLGEYIHANAPIKWQCLIDFHIWETAPHGILHHNTGCPKCANNIQLSNIDIDDRIKDSNITRIGQYINMTTPIDFQCLDVECLFIWKTRPGNIIYNHSGCPRCQFGKNQRLVFDLLQQSNIVFGSEVYINDIFAVDNNIHIDFYLSQQNTIIEYNGEQHYHPVDFSGHNMKRAEQIFIEYQQPRDAFVRMFCKEHNVRLIEIDGRKYINDKLKRYMLDEIIPSIIATTSIASNNEAYTQ